MKEKFGYIYKITHIPTGRYYIGQHRSSKFDQGYWGSGVVIRKLLNRHNKTEFFREVLAWAETREELNFLESKYVDKKSLFDKKCLNQKTGGNMFVMSNSAKIKLSASLKGNKNATHITKEGRARLSKFRIEQNEKLIKMPEYRKKLSDSLKEYYKKNPRPTGWHHTVETKTKISIANHNRSAEQISYVYSKVIEANHKRVGEKRTEETKRKISEAKKKYWKEQKEKVR